MRTPVNGYLSTWWAGAKIVFALSVLWAFAAGVVNLVQAVL